MGKKKESSPFAKHLKELHKKCGTTAIAVSKKLGLSQQHYQKYYSQNKTDMIETFVRVKYILDVSFEELFEPFISSEYLKMTKEEKIIDDICRKIKNLCRENKEFEKSFLFLMEAMKIPEKKDIPKLKRVACGDRTG